MLKHDTMLVIMDMDKDVPNRGQSHVHLHISMTRVLPPALIAACSLLPAEKKHINRFPLNTMLRGAANRHFNPTKKTSVRDVTISGQRIYPYGTPYKIIFPGITKPHGPNLYGYVFFMPFVYDYLI